MKRSKSGKPESLLDQLAAPLRQFVQDFRSHGPSTLERVREQSPERYLELSTKLVSVIATLRPAESEFKEARTMQDIGRAHLRNVGLEDPTDDQIAEAIAANDRFIAGLEQIRDRALGTEPITPIN